MTDFASMMFRPRTDSMHKGQWFNGKRTISGWWEYIWQSDRFFIILNQKDRTTGEDQKSFSISNDTPEWGKFKLVKEN